MSNNERIAKNTIALCFRMFIIMAVGIYTSRVVLNALGISDYGIYNIVGGIVVLLTAVTNGMIFSVQRFLNFEIGRGASGNVSRVFSMSLIIHALMAVVLFVLLETVGYKYFWQNLNIPEARRDAALVVFHLSALSSCLTFVGIPFYALIIAYEKMTVYAYTSVIDVLMKLGIVYLLMALPGDRLITYAWLMLCVTIVGIIVNMTICRVQFKHVKYSFKFHKDLFKEMTSFASWTTLSEMAWAVTNQGGNILLNLFFGTALNAAFGIAMQVNSAIRRFTTSFQTAIIPQIVKQYAAGEVDSMMQLVYRGSRYACYLLALVIVPLSFKIDVVLAAWLKIVPAYANIFCLLVMANLMLSTISYYFDTVANAVGKIKKFRICISLVLFMNFPLSWLALKLWHIPYLVFVVYGLVSIAMQCTQICLVSGLLHRPIFASFLREVVLMVVGALCVAVGCSFGLSRLFTSTSFISVLAFLALSFLATAASCYVVGLNCSEKRHVIEVVKKRLSRK